MFWTTQPCKAEIKSGPVRLPWNFAQSSSRSPDCADRMLCAYDLLNHAGVTGNHDHDPFCGCRRRMKDLFFESLEPCGVGTSLYSKLSSEDAQQFLSLARAYQWSLRP